MRRKPAELTHLRLTDLLSYNPHTGLLAWRKTRARTAKAGDEAGTVNKTGTVVVGLDGRIYTAARLCWFHVHGAWPTSRLRFRDHDQQNLKLANLVPEDKLIRDPSPQSLYQRQWRKNRREVDKRIMTDPLLYNTYRHAELYEPESIPAIRRRILEQIHDDRERYAFGAQHRLPRR